MRTLIYKIMTISIFLCRFASGENAPVLPLELSIGDSCEQFVLQYQDSKALFPVIKDDTGKISDGLWMCEIAENIFWSNCMVRVKGGNIVSIGYTSVEDSVDNVKRYIPVIFEKLVERFGNFENRYIAEHLSKGPKVMAPIFVWKSENTVVGFSYTPFKKYTEGEIFKCILTLLDNQSDWKERLSITDVDPNEMEELFRDVKLGAPKASDVEVLVEKEKDVGSLTTLSKIVILTIATIIVGVVAFMFWNKSKKNRRSELN